MCFSSESYSDGLDSKWHDSFRLVSDSGDQDLQMLLEAGGWGRDSFWILSKDF